MKNQNLKILRQELGHKEKRESEFFSKPQREAFFNGFRLKDYATVRHR